MEWFIAVLVVAALGVAAVVAAGGLGEMAKEPVRDVYRQDLPEDRPLGAADIQRLKFGISLRGYAMGQVDDVLDRLAGEIADRDSLIARLLAENPQQPEAEAEVAPGSEPGGAPQDAAAEMPARAPDESVGPAESIMPAEEAVAPEPERA